MVNVLMAIVVAAWISGVAILAVQNATLVSLKFLAFRSVQMPFGTVLAFCAAGGAIGTAFLQLAWAVSSRSRRERSPQ
jgi:uncharacterized integral membrane protein